MIKEGEQPEPSMVRTMLYNRGLLTPSVCSTTINTGVDLHSLEVSSFEVWNGSGAGAT